MTILLSAHSPKMKRRLPLCAVMGFLLSSGLSEPPNTNSTEFRELSANYPELDDLSGELLLDGVGLTGDAIRGLVIRDLDKAKISDKVVDKLVLFKCDLHFQKRLCEECKKPSSILGAYVMLNTLYPEKRLNLVTGQIVNSDDGLSDVPIKVVSGHEVLKTRISRDQLGVIVYEYWRHHFGIKSEAELNYEKMVRKEEQKERERKGQNSGSSVDP